MKISKLIKKSTIQKEAMPEWTIGDIHLKFHAGDVNELICKVHMYDDRKLIGTIFLDQQGKRIIKYNFKHPDMRDVLDWLKEKSKENAGLTNRTVIEIKFGEKLFDAKYIKDFEIKDGFVKLILSTPKRKTPIFEIANAEDFFGNAVEWSKTLTKNDQWKFEWDGLVFKDKTNTWWMINWSELLFYD
jgi:hypothetical protein